LPQAILGEGGDNQCALRPDCGVGFGDSTLVVMMIAAISDDGRITYDSESDT
jgi:hypothetical protein